MYPVQKRAPGLAKHMQELHVAHIKKQVTMQTFVGYRKHHTCFAVALLHLQQVVLSNRLLRARLHLHVPCWRKALQCR